VPTGESERSEHAVKAIAKRLRRLEGQVGTVDGKPQLLLVVSPAGSVLALDRDNCIRILRECGHLPTGPVSVLNFSRIPVGLSAEELEQHLRQHGAELRRMGPAE